MSLGLAYMQMAHVCARCVVPVAAAAPGFHLADALRVLYHPDATHVGRYTYNVAWPSLWAWDLLLSYQKLHGTQAMLVEMRHAGCTSCLILVSPVSVKSSKSSQDDGALLHSTLV